MRKAIYEVIEKGGERQPAATATAATITENLKI